MSSKKSELRRDAASNRVRRGKEAERLSAVIADYLTGSPDWRAAEAILAYRPLSGEVETATIVERAAAEGKRVYYPRVADGRLLFHSPPAGGVYHRGGLGVEEPDPAWELWTPGEAGRVLVLVPALGFDRRGFRLGRGAGYYDRFAAETRRALGKRVRFGGLCFSRSILEELPEDPWDQPMDWVLTDTGFVSP